MAGVEKAVVGSLQAVTSRSERIDAEGFGAGCQCESPARIS